MDFYGIEYLNNQSNLGDMIKYGIVFTSLIFLIFFFSLWMKHRIKTKYRNISIIIFLLLIFVSGVQFSEYSQNEDLLSQSTRVNDFIKIVAKNEHVSSNKVYVNSRQLYDGMLVRIDKDNFRVEFNPDFSAYELHKTNLMSDEINLIK